METILVHEAMERIQECVARMDIKMKNVFGQDLDLNLVAITM